jgi:ribosome-binding factor A
MSRQKNPFKKDKYEERLVNEINGLLRRNVRDDRLKFVSVTKVELSPDYAYAKVFWDTFDSSKRGDAKKAIEQSAGYLRSELAKLLEVRHVPSLSFEYDNQFEEANKIDKLLKDANQSSDE